MLFGIAGRKGNGKSIICNYLMDLGFKKASFAAGLKEYLAELFNWDIQDLMTLQGKEEILEYPVKWNKEMCFRLEKITGLDWHFEGDKAFNTRRDALQYLGTDIIRKQRPDFHINEFKKRFSNGDFVCDDLRFQNELSVLKELNADCIYVVRPDYPEYSNHASETSVLRNDFDTVLVNDGTLEEFLEKSRAYFDHLIFENKLDEENRLSKKNISTLLVKYNNDVCQVASEIDCEVSTVQWWAEKYGLDTIINDIDHNAFYSVNATSAYWMGVLWGNSRLRENADNQLFLSARFKNLDLAERFRDYVGTTDLIFESHYGFSIEIYSPYIIHDLKLWNYPFDLVRNPSFKEPGLVNDEFSEYFDDWFLGFADNKGKMNDFGLAIECNEEITKFVLSMWGFGGQTLGESNITFYKDDFKRLLSYYKLDEERWR